MSAATSTTSAAAHSADDACRTPGGSRRPQKKQGAGFTVVHAATSVLSHKGSSRPTLKPFRHDGARTSQAAESSIGGLECAQALAGGLVRSRLKAEGTLRSDDSNRPFLNLRRDCPRRAGYGEAQLEFSRRCLRHEAAYASITVRAVRFRTCLNVVGWLMAGARLPMPPMTDG